MPGFMGLPTVAPYKPLGTLPPLPVVPTLAPVHLGGLPVNIPAVTVAKTHTTAMSERTTQTTAALDTSQGKTTSMEAAAQETTTASVSIHLAVTESTSSTSQLQTEPEANESTTSALVQAAEPDDKAVNKTTVGTSTPVTTDAPVVTNTTTSASTSTSTSAGCDVLCEVPGKTGASSKRMATCKSLIQKSAFHDFLGDVDSCPKARDLVLNQCPTCAACPLSAAGCGILEPISTAAPQIRGPPCEQRCVFRESKAKCGSRIMWASQHSFPGKPDACNRAYSLVLEQCPICKQCTSRAAGCPHAAGDATPQHQHGDGRTNSDLFDCQRLSDFKENGQKERISWCCKHKNLGCEGNIDVLQRFGGEHKLQATISSSMRSYTANVCVAGFLSLFGGYMVARRCSQTAVVATQIPERRYADLPETRALLE